MDIYSKTVNFVTLALNIYTNLALFGICLGQSFPANFIFGDSLVDTGNNNYIVSLSKANYAPNGIDFGSPTGRFTNGRTVIDIIGNILLFRFCQELGFKHFAPPYLAPTTSGPIVLDGVNYASGGSGIFNETGIIFGGRINFDAQIDNFVNTKQDIISQIGLMATMQLFEKSLFSVTIGSNDFTNNYLGPKQMLVSPDKFVRAMISRLKSQLNRLYNLGARKIVVVSVGTIGCIPYQRDINFKLGDNCAALPNELAQSFNTQLRSLVLELNANLKGSKFVYANAYHVMKDILDNYIKYGFEYQNSSCCCYLAGRFGGLIPCGPSSKVCLDRSKYVFWDAYHPSDASNVIIANHFLDGDTTFISPMNIRKLFSS
ncbi:hypothetical protein F8388_025103 [Cannabis sativa]|uniref:GDSL esterase/lipase n=1 Tax=Cannabis sativa TaxID=3483 RepID=A0A7J6FJ33_CANSA|nr:hypothetical protein F8388_025103 [Cannabis sativa]